MWFSFFIELQEMGGALDHRPFDLEWVQFEHKRRCCHYQQFQYFGEGQHGGVGWVFNFS